MISVGKVMTRNINPLLVNQTLREGLAELEKSTFCGLPVVDPSHKVLGILFRDCDLAKFREDMPLGK